MNPTFYLRGIMLLFIIITIACGGKKETVNYEPRPDPFPKPEEEDFNRRRQPEVTPEPVETPDKLDKLPLVLNTVYFEFDQSRLTSETQNTLAQNAKVLAEYPNTTIRVEGHCDERGTVEYNLALGERRALAVRNYLVDFGIARNRISVISYGKERPVDPRHNEEAWSKNRRAEFIILN